MAKDEKTTAAPIIIRRIKKAGHDAHHGGAWKVAYADFVTAMMAFFLLLWLLQATTEEQKLGIADYFAPAAVARSKSGAGGILAGRTFTDEGARAHDQAPIGVMIELPTNPEDTESPETPEDPSETEAAELPEVLGESTEELDETELDRFLAKREEQQFAAAEEILRQAIDRIPELKDLANNLIIDQTDEGMRVQIVDQAGNSMFPSGSAEMFHHTTRLLALVVDAIRQLPQQIAIKGHTDATPFAGKGEYSNWELSSDRANSSRRALIRGGLPPDRVASVVGLADQDPLDLEDPYAARNRRISIILLRENPQFGRTGAIDP